MFANYGSSCRTLSLFATLVSLLFCAVANAEEQAVAGDVSEQAGPAGAPGNAVADPSDPWHIWFHNVPLISGVHGTTGAVNGPDIDFRASAGDLLSHFKFGLMGGGRG
jgi:hypothetical protein